MIRFLAGTFMLLLPTAVIASSPSIILHLEESGVVMTKVVLPDASGSFTHDIGDIGTNLKQVTLKNIDSKSVEHQFDLQVAIYDEGPWENLFGIQKKSPWKKLVLKDDGTICEGGKLSCHPRSDEEVSIVTTQKAIDAAILKTSEPKRWKPLAVKCLSADGTILVDGHCNIYRSSDTYRFRDTRGKQYEFILSYAGGC